MQDRADEVAVDSRFSFRREFDQAFQIYKKLNNEMFMLKNVVTTQTHFFLYEDVYDVSFHVYEGFMMHYFKTKVLAPGIWYRLLGTLAENFVNIMDVINFLIFLLLFIITPIIMIEGFEGLCALLLISVLLQAYFSFKIRGIYKFLLPSMLLKLVAFALLITRNYKTVSASGGSGDLVENNYLCVDTTALGNFYSFETCDKHDKVYIWVTFALVYIGNACGIFVYFKFVRSQLHYLMMNNFYLYVMNKIRTHRIGLTIQHIKRNPAYYRWKMPFWETDISEQLHSTTVFVTTQILNCVLDDMIAGIESGKIKLKNFRIGRESLIVVEFLKELLKSKSKLLD